MYPTPTVVCERGRTIHGREQVRGFVSRRKGSDNVRIETIGRDLYLEKEKQMYHSPTTNDSKNLTFPRVRKQNISDWYMIQNKPGGNERDLCGVPNGISKNWTVNQQIKTLGNAIVPQIVREFDRNQKALSDSDSDGQGDNSFKYALNTKGKLNRSESNNLQKHYSDVAMEHLKDNQHLINEKDEKFKTRPDLPPKDIFLNT